MEFYVPLNFIHKSVVYIYLNVIPIFCECTYQFFTFSIIKREVTAFHPNQLLSCVVFPFCIFITFLFNIIFHWFQLRSFIFKLINCEHRHLIRSELHNVDSSAFFFFRSLSLTKIFSAVHTTRISWLCLCSCHYDPRNRIYNKIPSNVDFGFYLFEMSVCVRFCFIHSLPHFLCCKKSWMKELWREEHTNLLTNSFHYIS